MSPTASVPSPTPTSRPACGPSASTPAPGPRPRDAAEAPGPPGGPMAAVRRLRADPLSRFVEIHHRYGPVARLASWPVSAFLVSDPDAIADALVSGHRLYAKGAVVRA